MAHRHDVYEYGIYREHEIKYVGKFGAKGEKRAKKKTGKRKYYGRSDATLNQAICG